MNSPDHFAAHFLRQLPLLGLLACVSVGVMARSARAQDLYDFSSLAAEAAGAIDKASAGPMRTTVLVTDFEESSVPDSQLATVLTQNFSQSLRNHAHNFTVLDRTEIEAAISSRQLPAGALSSRGVTSCYAPDIGASIIVGGRIACTAENVILDLDVRASAEGDGIFGKKISTPLTPQMEALKSQPAAHTEPIFGEDKSVWAKDGNSQTKIPHAWPAAPGYSSPACLYCPQARYSDAAVRAKIAGTLVLSVVIGADGAAQRISVQRALPCGLDQQAIEAVKGWRFRAATDPDGKPATVVQTIEVTFHMY
jgi:TonB family protein